ncbi:MAG TPA: ATP-binding protein [Candidatus Eremiobacteraeota bacterium]|nr:MAG: Archaeal ATPase [bacterium ADurb.Bin363]HPZ07061.1 ATP-binding protein [Candidatus Eremiobacteraeota bacterium]
MFINRLQELEVLEKFYKSSESQFLIIYGRRRIGKTELLKYFARDKKHLFYSADLSSEQEQLRQFTEKLYSLTGDAFLKNHSFPGWENLLNYLFDHVVKKIPLIIFDEFPYLCMSNKALPSILQKIWDEKGKDSGVFLVLCGSYMSFMEKEVLSSKSPLYGRRTGQMILQPFRYKVLKEFFPLYTEEEQVMVYSIGGGTPAYLRRFNDRYSISENVKEQILAKNSLLYKEPRFLLMEELREPSIYFSILKAIASGKTRLNEISQETGLEDRHKVNKYLTVLRELNIIKREVPVTEEKPDRSRKGIYLLEDPFFRFWFRFVYPNLSYLEEDEIDYVWEKKINPYLNDFTGFIFEDICRQKLIELNKIDMLPFKAEKIGRWWDGKEEIDIMATGEKGEYLFCECKWSVKHVGVSVYEKLQEKSNRISENRKKYLCFFSRSGFSDELKKLSRDMGNIYLFDYY